MLDQLLQLVTPFLDTIDNALNTVVGVLGMVKDLPGVAITAIAAYVVWFTTWTLYLAVMNLKMERDRLKLEGKDFTIEQKIFGYPMLLIGLCMDVVMNFFVGTILFLEIPKEMLLTTRCQRHMKDDTKRGKMARWICKHFLDPFEIGGHC